MKSLVLAVLLGLVTYFVHGVLNNFLDTDKASVPFWGFIAILVVIDIYHSRVKSFMHDNASARDNGHSSAVDGNGWLK